MRFGLHLCVDGAASCVASVFVGNVAFLLRSFWKLQRFAMTLLVGEVFSGVWKWGIQERVGSVSRGLVFDCFSFCFIDLESGETVHCLPCFGRVRLLDCQLDYSIALGRQEAESLDMW